MAKYATTISLDFPNYEFLSSADECKSNKSKFINKLVDLYRKQKLKRLLREGAKQQDQEDLDWAEFDVTNDID